MRAAAMWNWREKSAASEHEGTAPGPFGPIGPVPGQESEAASAAGVDDGRTVPGDHVIQEAMESEGERGATELWQKISYLNNIGVLAPLLGLLGTVLGMIHAFSTMQAKGGATTPADLAGGVSIALTHTFLGLFLAIPCLAAFGVLRTMVDRLTIRGALVAEELLLMIKPADSRSASAAPAAQVAATPPPPARPTAAPQPARVVPPPYPAPPTP